MPQTKVTIDTTPDKKKALNETLREQGTTVSEWLNEKISETTGEPVSVYQHKCYDLTALSELSVTEQVFKRLSHQDWSFTDADTTYLSHNIHPYPAKYIPQLPNNIIRQLSVPGETVWDPFGGSGTTALEAILLGRKAISSDINPLSSIVGEAKTATLTSEDEDAIEELLEKIGLLSSNALHFKDTYDRHQTSIESNLPNIPNQDKWFHKNAWKELGYLKWRIENLENDNAMKLAKSAFSKIIVRVSFQDGETRYASKPRNVEKCFVLKTFVAELKSTLNKIKRLSHLLRFRKASFITADLRNERVMPDSSVDLIVTSPPYPNATDYHLYHRFRIFLLGFDPRLLAKKEIGSHLRHQKEGTGIEQYLDEMSMCLSNIFQALRSGRYTVMIIGDAIYKGKEYKTSELVGELAEKVGYEFVGIFKRKVHSTKRSFISPARRLKNENFLVLRKPVKEISFTLTPPPYKLWPYEDIIRKLEIQTVLANPLQDKKTGKTKVTCSPLCTDKIRRLTFTHGFFAKDYAQESTWQAILENGDAFNTKSNRKDPKYVTHGLHPYKGKFYPQLAKSLLNLANLKTGQSVFDPFCGSGTVLLESYLNGLNANGFDLNPMALKIAKIKTDILQVEPHITDRTLFQFIKKTEKITDDTANRSIFNETCMSELESWFPSLVLNKLAWILRAIDDIPQPTIREFLEVCLSSIVREVSQQDPKDLRIRRRKPQIEDAPVKELFQKKLNEQRLRLRQFAQRSNQVPFDFGHASVWEADCRAPDSFVTANIIPGSIDAVITSPPYATALPYVDTDRLSILLLMALKSKERKAVEDNLVGARDISRNNREALEDKITSKTFTNILSNTAHKIISKVYTSNENSGVGFRRKNMGSLLYRYYSDMSSVLKNLDDVISTNGSLFFVIGDNLTKAGDAKEEIIIENSKVLHEIGKNLGWNLEKIIPITVTQENRHHNKNSMLHNDIIWFRK